MKKVHFYIGLPGYWKKIEDKSTGQNKILSIGRTEEKFLELDLVYFIDCLINYITEEKSRSLKSFEMDSSYLDY